MAACQAIPPIPSASCLPGSAACRVAVMVDGSSIRQQDLILRISESAFQLDSAYGDGGASVIASETIRVRLLSADDCSEVTGFDAEPGSQWLIQVADDPVSTEDWTGKVMTLGPGLPALDQNPCL
jgi:hypothetical protein